MFKGIKPTAQPRSFRSIAESNDSGNFPADPIQQEPQQVDVAAAAQPSAGANRGVSSADKQPFTNIRGGK